jgi:hypothetical protein
MEKELFRTLLNSIHHYYPIGVPRLPGRHDLAAEIISKKLEQGGELEKNWKNLMGDLKIVNEKFSNYSFIQFPSLIAVAEKPTEHGNILATSSFVLCVSLLTPYYTYFFQYGHSIKSIVNFNKITFFKNGQFDTFKFSVDVTKIDDAVKKYFPNYQFIDHYYLMVNNIIGGVPYGKSDNYADGKTPYSLYQFLFNSDQDHDVYP